jgi:hypothetical protein
MSKRRTLPPFRGGPLTIALPGGQVRLRNGVLSCHGCIVGLDLDRDVALVRLPRRDSNDPGIVMEQLTGWLCARKRRVIRIHGCGPRQRILARIQHPAQVRSIVVHWARSHIGDLERRTGPDLPRHLLVEGAPRDVWRKASEFWADTLAMLQALGSIDPQLVLDVGEGLSRVATRWEFRCARLERRGTNEGWFGSEDRELIATCDRHLKGCLRFVPCYRMIPHTICRLL